MLSSKPNFSHPFRYERCSPFDIVERVKPGTLRELYLKRCSEFARESSPPFPNRSHRVEQSAPQAAPKGSSSFEELREELRAALTLAGLFDASLSTLDFSSFKLRERRLAYFEKGEKKWLDLTDSHLEIFKRFEAAGSQAKERCDSDRAIFPSLAHLRSSALARPHTSRAIRLRGSASPGSPRSDLKGSGGPSHSFVRAARLLDTVKSGAEEFGAVESGAVGSSAVGPIKEALRKQRAEPGPGDSATLVLPPATQDIPKPAQKDGTHRVELRKDPPASVGSADPVPGADDVDAPVASEGGGEERAIISKSEPPPLHPGEDTEVLATDGLAQRAAESFAAEGTNVKDLEGDPSSVGVKRDGIDVNSTSLPADLSALISELAMPNRRRSIALTSDFEGKIMKFSEGLDAVRKGFEIPKELEAGPGAVSRDLSDRTAQLLSLFEAVSKWWNGPSKKLVLANYPGNSELNRRWQAACNSMEMSLEMMCVVRLSNLETRLQRPTSTLDKSNANKFLSAAEAELCSLCRYLLEAARR